ncbi:MAG: Maf family nucleotide pyrophosphatase [Candidatus Ancillula sp.]|nr:Maf family nucleotide pyrophosphatase [Candidatus Ancillula sp.]
MIKFILASNSPARLKTLKNSGLDPKVIVSQVDEDKILLEINNSSFEEQVKKLAEAKANSVASRIFGKDHGYLKNDLETNISKLVEDKTAKQTRLDIENNNFVILGCDSMFEIDGKLQGKPHTPQVARERIKNMRGKWGILHTGHSLIYKSAFNDKIVSTSRIVSTKVKFGDISDFEIEKYIITGEPLEVAGSFTIDSLGAAFIEKIEGDYHSVVGVSLYALRQMAEELGFQYTDLWT